jgi:hypothetical protein
MVAWNYQSIKICPKCFEMPSKKISKGHMLSAPHLKTALHGYPLFDAVAFNPSKKPKISACIPFC